MFFPNFVFQEKCDGIRCWCISVVELSLNFDLSRAVHMYNAPAPDDLSRDSMVRALTLSWLGVGAVKRILLDLIHNPYGWIFV
ncbi:hypothetical protein Y032_0018g3516 [Ancylostoma ceylanicum]|uniref:Uncharacterized protein n=1 Tax=Ancylostoma ceylanicum TaxID=53326 RepID=A0A016V2S2_9BILA|nr:hypothetical protein Y032_0018g3516 [Ancylostoma ceylanicum]